MHHYFLSICISIALLCCTPKIAQAENKPIEPTPFTGTINFKRDVMPIFVQHCIKCHGPEKQKGKLRLDNREAVLQKGSLSGPVINKKQPAKSSLYIRIAHLDEFEDPMPPKGPALSPKQVGIIHAWIKQGTPWPDGVGVDLKDATFKKHWAYVKPKRAALPKVSDPTWCQTPIDYFILAKLDAAGLKPSPQADKAKLLRRVSLDLIGLPPSVEQIQAFVADTSPNAYEKAVDHLLASRHYGEKWARQWLDLARYADSNGFQADQLRDSWPYRDWVINAMNADMSFDQFTIEQIAGDLLPNPTIQQRIATGFHRTVTCNVEAGVHPEQNRTNQIFDRVNTTGTVWLGTTFECAQCHNHKYDPFTSKDYYQLFAYFNNTLLEVKQQGNGVTWEFYGPKLELPLTGDTLKHKQALQAKLAQLEKQKDANKATASKKQRAWEQQFTSTTKKPTKWHTLDITSFISKGGASHKILQDKSVLLTGKAPQKDIYTATVHTDLLGITAFKFEALTHDSIPGKGPGRGEASRPNFVLYEITGQASLVHSDPKKASPSIPITFADASADYSQPKWHVKNLIDGKSTTGWAIAGEFHKSHEATLFTSMPLNAVSKQLTAYTFTLPQHYGGARTIGRLRISALTGTPSKNVLPANIAKALKVPRSKRTKNQIKSINDYYAKSVTNNSAVNKAISALKADIAKIKPTSTLVMVEQDKPRLTHILKRGEYLNPGDKVSPNAPASLLAMKSSYPKNRIGLAKWLVDRDNPLTARVAANRWWESFFGHAIVASVEDFGTQSDPPTHPELLDWLAVELMDGRTSLTTTTTRTASETASNTATNDQPRKWSMKHLHRLIVTSATYKQSSSVNPILLGRDPTNKLYARGPRFRIDAELVRDNALAISGLLSTKMAGPPIMPPQPDGIWRHVGRNAPKWKAATNEDRFRRGIYIVWRRSAPYPSMVTFDAPDRSACTAKRPRTNTPLQALTLLNDPAYVEFALALAQRILLENKGENLQAKLDYGFQLCTGRLPNPKERTILLATLTNAQKDIAANKAAISQLLSAARTLQLDKTLEPADLAAWFRVANVLLNLDETITKG
jgi:hypothetical protein